MEWTWIRTYRRPLVVGGSTTPVPFRANSCPNQSHQENIGTIFLSSPKLLIFRSLRVKNCLYTLVLKKNVCLRVSVCFWKMNCMISEQFFLIKRRCSFGNCDVFLSHSTESISHPRSTDGSGGVCKNRPAAGMKSSPSAVGEKRLMRSPWLSLKQRSLPG